MLVFAGGLWLLSPSAWSTPTDYALIMPGARSSLLLDIAVAGDRLVAVGERGHILYSEDEGKNWVQATVPTSVMLTRVFFATETRGWAVGHDGNILLSSDGGVNWVLQRDGVSDQAQINEERVARAEGEVRELQQQIATASAEREDELQEALDEAQYGLETALETMDEPVYAPPLMDVWFSSEERGWASGAFGSLLHTSNSGRSWEDYSFKLDSPEEPHLNGVAGDSSGTLYLASEWGVVFRSRSDGETWEALQTDFEGSFFGVVINPVTDSVFAYGLLGTVYHSTDHGETWQEVNTMTRNSLFGAASAADGRLVFVGDNGTAVLTDDDGNTFSVLRTGTARGLYGVTLPGEQLVVVSGEGGSSRLTRTTDSGRQIAP